MFRLACFLTSVPKQIPLRGRGFNVDMVKPNGSKSGDQLKLFHLHPDRDLGWVLWRRLRSHPLMEGYVVVS